MSSNADLRVFRRWMILPLCLTALPAGCDHAADPRAQQPAMELTEHSPVHQFDLQGLSIPESEIHSGGPPKDGIPAISEPQFLDASAAESLWPEDRVIGVALGDEARAYPLQILTRHEVVNDRIGDQPVAVTYCPLCDSSFVFNRRISGRDVEFGVSGLLYNNNVLMYDRNDRGREGLWSQLGSAAVSGECAQNTLQSVPFEVTTWGEWSQRHPRTKVLSRDTGYPVNYDVDPYDGYADSPALMFPTTPPAPTDRLSLKSPVLGVWNADGARAYSLLRFDDQESASVSETLGTTSFTLVYDAVGDSLRISGVQGELNYAYAFWFAWYAFHPQTEVYEPAR